MFVPKEIIDRMNKNAVSSFRDEIAIKAMQAMLPEFRFGLDELAEKSYQIADAMLKARENDIKE